MCNRCIKFMFTGIIETIGAVEKNRAGRLEVLVSLKFGNGIKTGSSVAVNGACLTIIQNVKFKIQNLLCFDVVPETFSRTNLGLLKKGDTVNLERALKAGGRFEGHIAQGHVEAVARITNIEDGIFTIEFSKEYMRYIVPKGSVSVDGISLTVVDVLKNYFTVAVIPRTMENTIAKFYKKGSVVNIEVDIIGKYVENLLNHCIKK